MDLGDRPKIVAEAPAVVEARDTSDWGLSWDRELFMYDAIHRTIAGVVGGQARFKIMPIEDPLCIYLASPNGHEIAQGTSDRVVGTEAAQLARLGAIKATEVPFAFQLRGESIELVARCVNETFLPWDDEPDKNRDPRVREPIGARYPDGPPYAHSEVVHIVGRVGSGKGHTEHRITDAASFSAFLGVRTMARQPDLR